MRTNFDEEGSEPRKENLFPSAPRDFVEVTSLSLNSLEIFLCIHLTKCIKYVKRVEREKLREKLKKVVHVQRIQKGICFWQWVCFQIYWKIEMMPLLCS